MDLVQVKKFYPETYAAIFEAGRYHEIYWRKERQREEASLQSHKVKQRRKLARA
jgi:hypothetical protein